MDIPNRSRQRRERSPSCYKAATGGRAGVLFDADRRTGATTGRGFMGGVAGLTTPPLSFQAFAQEPLLHRPPLGFGQLAVDGG